MTHFDRLAAEAHRRNGRPNRFIRNALGSRLSREACPQIERHCHAAVALEPSVPGAPPPFDGELPAELATTVTWVLAGVEPAAADGGGAATAQVMNLPCAIGERRFPLYYLCGTVPLSALGRMQQRR